MKAYRVIFFTEDNYNKYMSGSNNYDSDCMSVNADSKEEAIAKAKAKKPGYVIHEHAVEDFETIQTREENFKAWVENKATKEKQAQAKRKATEQKKAEEAGLTVKEYRAEIARKATITRLTNEIAELEKEIKRKKAALKRISH